ncbi:hypothetical protein GCM10010193_28700 [Kitasatospora atroaurantiaca]
MRSSTIEALNPFWSTPMTAALLVVTGAAHRTLTDGTPHPIGCRAERLAEPHRIRTVNLQRGTTR